MGIINRLFQKNVTVSSFKMMTDEGNGYYSYNGNLYQSDIVRSAIRPKARAIGKAIAKHIRKSNDSLKVNPDAYMRFLLEEPNPYMSGQMLQEKLITHLELNNNAFAYIQRDSNGYPVGIYPINPTSSEAVEDVSGELFLRFILRQGQVVTFRYSDVIHLRKDFNSNKIFGDSPASALTPLMEIVTTTDQGIVKAIKNSNVIKWLLKFNGSLRPEDMKKQVDEFINNYMNTESTTIGAAGVDSKAEAIQLTPNDYLPNATQMDKTVQRILSFYGTNLKITQGSYSENEWISYYESSCEPDIIQLSNEYTRKLFTRKERGFGNKIIFESSNMSYASMQTKLSLVALVDRGIISPNEHREILNYAPVEGGDEMIRRLDTAPVNPTNKGSFSNKMSNSINGQKTYAIDFDGTLCENIYPNIGYAKQDVINYVKQLQSAGNKVILWTCRTGENLEEAISWCKDKGIEFDGVNENLEEIINTYGSDTRKIVADVYVDDKALNVKDI